MSVYIIGDVHGHLDKVLELLVAAHLIDDTQRWIGGDAHLWFMGDFFDRGPDGIGAVDLVMRLQSQAADAGGEIRALLGNHEILFLAAHRFQETRKFPQNWKRNGGQQSDMDRVTSRQIAWLRSLPALVRVENRLLMHADAMFYLDYGETIDEVNAALSMVLRSDDTDAWDELIDAFAERMAFSSLYEGAENIHECLTFYGGRQIIHGHTPIQYMMNVRAPKSAFLYAGNLCVDVDGGIYLGGPGFVHKLP